MIAQALPAAVLNVPAFSTFPPAGAAGFGSSAGAPDSRKFTAMLGQAVEEDEGEQSGQVNVELRVRLTALRAGEKMPGSGRQRKEMMTAARAQARSIELPVAPPPPEPSADRPAPLQDFSLAAGSWKVEGGLPVEVPIGASPPQVPPDVFAAHCDGRSVQSPATCAEGWPLAAQGIALGARPADADIELPKPRLPGEFAISHWIGGSLQPDPGRGSSTSLAVLSRDFASQPGPPLAVPSRATDTGSAVRAEPSPATTVNREVAPATAVPVRSLWKASPAPEIAVTVPSSARAKSQDVPSLQIEAAGTEATQSYVQAQAGGRKRATSADPNSPDDQTSQSTAEIPVWLDAAVAPIEVADSWEPTIAPPASPQRLSSREKAEAGIVDSVGTAGSVTPELAFANRLAHTALSCVRPEVQPAPTNSDRPNEVPPPEIAFTGRLVNVASGTPEDDAAAVDTPAVPASTAQSNREPEFPLGTPERTLSPAPLRKAAANSDPTPTTATVHPPPPDVSPRFVPAGEPGSVRRQPDFAEAPSPEARPSLAAEPQEDVRPAPTTHEIKLQLTGGEQRVDVRMVERGGYVHVDVRTTDTRLAGALREDLPALSTRLEQSGFRAENWHTGPAAAPDRQAMHQTTAGAAPQDQQDRSGQDRSRQQDGQQQHRNQKPQSKDDRKDFAWLFTSLR